MRLAAFGLAAVALSCGPLQEQPLRAPHDVAARVDELRPTDTSATQLQWRYEATDVVERFGSPDGGFRVHFTRAGRNAVPAADGNDSGVPDLVEAVAGVYDDVTGTYERTLGFRRPLSDATIPNNGGDGRFDVYLLDFGSGADGTFRVDQCLSSNQEQCIGYVVQENDFVGFGYPNATVATRILGSHEYFHAVQDAYDDGQGAVISEGTAVWATEQYDPSTSDFEGFISGYLSQADRSIDSPPPGPVPAYAYGSAIFFQFLTERYERALVRKLWERCVNGQGHPSEPANVADPGWVVQLDALLKADYQSSFAQAFREFATWNLYTGSAADPLKAYAQGARYPGPKTTAITAPYELRPMRVFYASSQYYRTPANGRAAMTAAVVDDPSTPENETEGLALILAVRKGGANAQVLTVASPPAGAETVDTSGASDLVVAVVNTARQGNGAILSKRPALCIGAPDEVTTCRNFYGGVDAGVDAGPGEVDAGAPDGGDGVYRPPPPEGCTCGMPGGGAPFLLVVLLAAALRRRAPAP